jgi:hypothetical protein
MRAGCQRLSMIIGWQTVGRLPSRRHVPSCRARFTLPVRARGSACVRLAPERTQQRSRIGRFLQALGVLHSSTI